ncbi:hypothetical protein NEOKW01_0242 [Nematocida sp. AWRm80]|nr:hypothetical protein NEOKW01_0242 [Nematocida sp. AWRm80]
MRREQIQETIETPRIQIESTQPPIKPYIRLPLLMGAINLVYSILIYIPEITLMRIHDYIENTNYLNPYNQNITMPFRLFDDKGEIIPMSKVDNTDNNAAIRKILGNRISWISQLATSIDTNELSRFKDTFSNCSVLGYLAGVVLGYIVIFIAYKPISSNVNRLNKYLLYILMGVCVFFCVVSSTYMLCNHIFVSSGLFLCLFVFSRVSLGFVFSLFRTSLMCNTSIIKDSLKNDSSKQKLVQKINITQTITGTLTMAASPLIYRLYQIHPYCMVVFIGCILCTMLYSLVEVRKYTEKQIDKTARTVEMSEIQSNNNAYSSIPSESSRIVEETEVEAVESEPTVHNIPRTPNYRYNPDSAYLIYPEQSSNSEQLRDRCINYLKVLFNDVMRHKKNIALICIWSTAFYFTWINGIIYLKTQIFSDLTSVSALLFMCTPFLGSTFALVFQRWMIKQYKNKSEFYTLLQGSTMTIFSILSIWAISTFLSESYEHYYMILSIGYDIFLFLICCTLATIMPGMALIVGGTVDNICMLEAFQGIISNFLNFLSVFCFATLYPVLKTQIWLAGASQLLILVVPGLLLFNRILKEKTPS